MILYVVVSAAGPAREVDVLVREAQKRSWDTCLIATPTVYPWLNAEALEQLTGHPIRHRPRMPWETDVLPKADAVIAAPLTFNTLTKWALGISDNVALGLLIELMGLGLPIVALPFINSALAAHPAYESSIAALRTLGVSVIAHEPHPPDTGDSVMFPWHEALDALKG